MEGKEQRNGHMTEHQMTMNELLYGKVKPIKTKHDSNLADSYLCPTCGRLVGFKNCTSDTWAWQADTCSKCDTVIDWESERKEE